MKGLGGLAALLRFGASRGPERGETTASGAKVNAQGAGEMPSKHDRAPPADKHRQRDGSVDANSEPAADGVLGAMPFEEFPEDRSFAALLASSVAHVEIGHGESPEAERARAMPATQGGDTQVRDNQVRDNQVPSSVLKDDAPVISPAVKPAPDRFGRPPLVAAMHPPERAPLPLGETHPIPLIAASASPACVTPPDVVFATRPPARTGTPVVANRGTRVPSETRVAADVVASPDVANPSASVSTNISTDASTDVPAHVVATPLYATNDVPNVPVTIEAPSVQAGPQAPVQAGPQAPAQAGPQAAVHAVVIASPAPAPDPALRHRKSHEPQISASTLDPNRAHLAPRPRDLIRSDMNSMRAGTTTPWVANADVTETKKANAVSSRRSTPAPTLPARDRVVGSERPSLPDVRRRPEENLAAAPLQKAFDTSARPDKGAVPHNMTARRTIAPAAAPAAAPAVPSMVASEEAPTLASMVASIIAPSLAPTVAPAFVPPTAPMVAHVQVHAASDVPRAHVAASTVSSERAPRRSPAQAKPEVPSVGHAVAFAALFPGVPISRPDHAVKAVPPPVPSVASQSSHPAPPRPAPVSDPASAPASDVDRPRAPTTGQVPVDVRPAVPGVSTGTPTMATAPAAGDPTLPAPMPPVGLSPPGPTPREAAPLLDHAIQDPTLHVGTLGSHAHMKLDAGQAGELSLHLRVRDGVADLRVDGAAAQSLDIRPSQVRTALAGEGISLGRFETSAPSSLPASAPPGASSPAPANPESAPRPDQLPDGAAATASGSGFGSPSGDGRPQWNLDDRQPDAARPAVVPRVATPTSAESSSPMPDGRDGLHVTA